MSRVEDIKPPVARKVPKEIVTHGDKRVDEYFWIRDRSNPGVIEYIEAENRYTEDMMKHTKPLQEKLFKEFKGRLMETDSTVPDKMDDYYYYSRTEAEKQYPIYCRKKGGLEAPEEIVLDINEAAGGNEFFNVEVCKISPDHKLCAYLADTDGSERHTLFVKDLRTGKVIENSIRDVAMAEWANDSRTLFYSIIDKEARPFKVMRHVLEADHKTDVEVYHEKDKMFCYLALTKTKSRAYIMITVMSTTTSEVRYVSADKPAEAFKVIKPRKHLLEYFVFHHGDEFYIVTNENAPNYKIVEAPVSDPSEKNWNVLLPHRENVAICVSEPQPWVEVFKDYVVVFELENAVPKLQVIDLKDKSSHEIRLPESMCAIKPANNPEFGSTKVRFNYSSFVTPPSVYDYDMKASKLELMKRQEVPGFDPSRYETERTFAKAKDGTKIPISLVHKKGLAKNGKNPAFLYGYGGYGDFEGPAPEFKIWLLSLLDRGFVCANAHIRGGGDLGKKWHEQGRMINKMNTFTDFIACAEHLVKEGYTSRDRLAIRGRSAGGLLIGAVTNMRPDLFKVVVAEVPFVDAINSMLDDTIPLTASEFEEWGNPGASKEHYDYFKRYSPYDNVEAKDYPNILTTGAWNDSRVQYWEPTKWTAKLRATKTDNNILLLKSTIVQGHSGASGRYDYLKWYAFMSAFVLDRLGIKE